MFLKQNGVHFVHCLQQGSKIEGVVLNRVCILGILCPKQGQGFKSPSGSTTPKYWSTSPTTPPPPEGLYWNLVASFLTNKQLQKIQIWS